MVYTICWNETRKTIFEKEMLVLYGKYNLWPLNIYNAPFQVYKIKQEGRTI